MFIIMCKDKNHNNSMLKILDAVMKILDTMMTWYPVFMQAFEMKKRMDVI